MVCTNTTLLQSSPRCQISSYASQSRRAVSGIGLFKEDIRAYAGDDFGKSVECIEKHKLCVCKPLS